MWQSYRCIIINIWWNFQSYFSYFKKMGIDVTFVSPDASEEELNAAFKHNTRAMFGETIANPALTVLDIEKFAKAATRT